MRYDQFVSRVQHRGGFRSQADTVAAIRATLETLAERLKGGEAEHLAAQLPQELAFYLRPSLVGTGDFALDEFFSRIGQREGVDAAAAAEHARVIAGVLGEAVSAGEISDVRTQLGSEFGTLFAARESGPASA
jgi:uncharacterized protein (DUF2267 family)